MPRRIALSNAWEMLPVCARLSHERTFRNRYQLIKFGPNLFVKVFIYLLIFVLLRLLKGLGVASPRRPALCHILHNGCCGCCFRHRLGSVIPGWCQLNLTSGLEFDAATNCAAIVRC